MAGCSCSSHAWFSSFRGFTIGSFHPIPIHARFCDFSLSKTLDRCTCGGWIFSLVCNLLWFLLLGFELVDLVDYHAKGLLKNQVVGLLEDFHLKVLGYTWWKLIVESSVHVILNNSMHELFNLLLVEHLDEFVGTKMWKSNGMGVAFEKTIVGDRKDNFLL